MNKDEQFYAFKEQIKQDLKNSPEFKRFCELLVKGKWEARFIFKIPKRRGRPKGSKNKKPAIGRRKNHE